MKSNIIQSRRLRLATKISRVLDQRDLFVDYDSANPAAVGAEEGLLLNIRRAGQIVGSFRLLGGLKSEPFAISDAAGVMVDDNDIIEAVKRSIAGGDA